MLIKALKRKAANAGNLYEMFNNPEEMIKYGFDGDIVESKSAGTARMILENGKYRMEINPEFMKEYASEKADRQFVICHEILHRMRGDLLRDIINEDDARGKDAANIVMDISINKILLNTLFKDSDVGILRKMYSNKGIICTILLPPNEISGGIEKQLIEANRKENIEYSKESLGKFAELYSALWENEISISKAYEMLIKILHKFPEIKVKVKFLGEHNPDFRIKRRYEDLTDNINDDTSRLKEYYIKKRRKEWNAVYLGIKKSINSGSGTKAFREEFKKESSPVPCLSRRDILWMQMGWQQVLYKGELIKKDISNENELNIYIDVSGSFYEAYPFIMGFITSIRDFVPDKIYQFSEGVKKISYHDFCSGKVETSFGTNLNSVIEHLLKIGKRKALIISDFECCRVRKKNMDSIIKNNIKLFTVEVNKNINSHNPLKDVSKESWHIRI